MISLVPTDAQLWIEVQRAPDNGSNQPDVGAAVTIVAGLTVTPSGGLWRDVLPLDNQRRFYRARQHGSGYDPGPWTAWTLGYKPVVMKKDFLFNVMGGTFSLPILTPLMAVANDAITQPQIAPAAVGDSELIIQAVQRSKLGPQTVSDLAGQTSRNRFFNGDAEDLRAYWNSNPSGEGNTTLTVVNDADVITGSRTFKLAHTASAQEYFYQSDYGGTEATNPGNWVYLKVKQSSRIQVTYSCKVSGANVVGRVYVAEYGASGGLLSTTQVGTDVTSTVPVTREAEYTVGATTFYIVVRFASEGSSSGSVWYDDLELTDLVPFTDTLVNFKNLGLKSAAFQVDWKEGSSQYAEINGTNLAITLVNPEPGGHYRLYLKQNSQPDTVTWPTNVKWQNNTIPVLSTTTGRIDRINLEWTGAVYLGEMVQWWPETEQVLLPSGIESAAIFGASIVDRPHVDPSGIASAQAFGSIEVIRDDPVPVILTASVAWISGGDLCGSGGNFIVRVSWTVDDAPDGTYHITIDGVGGTIEPSVGFKDIDTGVGPVNLDFPHTDTVCFGPYTVRLRRDSDSGEVDNEATNQECVDYNLNFCI